MTLDRIWAGLRSTYIDSVVDDDDGGGAQPSGDCVFCAILTSGLAAEETFVVWQGDACAAILNAFPYTSGHLLVMPERHVGDLASVEGGERAELWDGVHTAVAAVTAAYRPEGVNIGVNLGRAAGAGVPGHLHVHVLPRWSGDSNFMTAVAEARVLPEPLSRTWEKLRAAWPAPPADA
jgi:ATP adenylyltransferase